MSTTGAAPAPAVRATDLSVRIGPRVILEPMNVILPHGEVTAILGPNGCGKSTLLRAIARLVPLASGRVEIDGTDSTTLKPRAFARRLSLLPQTPILPEGILVRELVSRGRTPHMRALMSRRPSDDAAIDAAMEATSVTHLALRRVDTLSGGQRQRVWIAMTLAQDTPVILFDEPTTWLDLPHQIDLLRLLVRLNRDQGRSIVMVLHDISLAARFADHIVALRDGKIAGAGPAGELITADFVKRVYDLDACVMSDPLHGTPLILPH